MQLRSWGGVAIGQIGKAIKGGGAPKPVVVAEAEVGGSVFKDTNQGARRSDLADENQPTLISERITAKVEATGEPKPNGNMADAHAEVGAIQQAYDAAKTQGAEMTMSHDQGCRFRCWGVQDLLLASRDAEAWRAVMTMVLGGYTLGSNSERHQLDVVESPSDEVIDQYVRRVAKGSGALGLRLRPEPEVGPYHLTMYSEEERFLLMLSENLVDGDHDVRTIVHGGIGDGLTLMLGEMYPAQAMTRDLDVVRLAFQEFSKNWNVPDTLMR